MDSINPSSSDTPPTPSETQTHTKLEPEFKNTPSLTPSAHKVESGPTAEHSKKKSTSKDIHLYDKPEGINLSTAPQPALNSSDPSQSSPLTTSSFEVSSKASPKSVIIPMDPSTSSPTLQQQTDVALPNNNTSEIENCDSSNNFHSSPTTVNTNDTILNPEINLVSISNNDATIISENDEKVYLSRSFSASSERIIKEISVTRQPSISKVQNAIHDILNHFDPLKEGANKNSIPSTDVKAEFSVDKSGFNYNRFLTQLRNPAAKPIAKEIKAFLVEFEKKSFTLNEQIRFTLEFNNYILKKMELNDIWKNMDSKDRDNAKEGVEKLIMNKIYPFCFSPQSTDDSAKDKVLRKKISLFRWIKESHLDIPTCAQNNSFIQFARAELVKMNEFKSPRDKLICVLNCCTVIFGLLKHVEGDVGADSFLPLLIYVIIISNPPKLASNINYISRFRSPEKLQSEAGYYLTNVLGAIAFIESMDHTCLSISKEEFDRNIDLSIWEIDSEKKARAKARLDAANSSKLPSSSKGYWGSILDEDQAERASWLLEKGSSLAKSTLEKTNQFVEKIISDLKISDSPSPPHLPSRRRPAQRQNPGNESTRVVESSSNWAPTLDLVCDMFPDVDKDVCEMVLQANDGFVPETIEQLLEMSMSEQIGQLSANENKIQSSNESIDIPSHITKPAALDNSNISTNHHADNHEEGDDDDWRGQWADDTSDDETSEKIESIRVSDNSTENKSNNPIVSKSVALEKSSNPEKSNAAEFSKLESSKAANNKESGLKLDEQDSRDIEIESGIPESSNSNKTTNGKGGKNRESSKSKNIPDVSNDEILAQMLQEEENIK
ncbi:Vacuolar protein sorting-associated protein 9a [Smittium culicis]|uniref:Vacuolar protein sorting-associated protein 9a n=1 Tax=Smittium culicis TaxID=133412 RepID=A0A1R1XZN2_9FUNG|nr:Vacuolar protein sorting-associated protein 9a [Smittium culicis]